MSWFRRLLAGLVRKPRRASDDSNRPRVHEFYGRHLLATYLGCDRAALANRAGLLRALESAARASGATVLHVADAVFPARGLTAVVLLAESHASLHTYPEYDACFVDLFTCGRACSAEAFDLRLREYLCPSMVHQQVLVRHGQTAADFLVVGGERGDGRWLKKPRRLGRDAGET
jgi:S-adenosylmethionine decarboxylase